VGSWIICLSEGRVWVETGKGRGEKEEGRIASILSALSMARLYSEIWPREPQSFGKEDRLKPSKGDADLRLMYIENPV
jgi:hypothetical protein